MPMPMNAHSHWLELTSETRRRLWVIMFVKCLLSIQGSLFRFNQSTSGFHFLAPKLLGTFTICYLWSPRCFLLSRLIHCPHLFGESSGDGQAKLAKVTEVCESASSRCRNVCTWLQHSSLVSTKGFSFWCWVANSPMHGFDDGCCPQRPPDNQAVEFIRLEERPYWFCECL